MRIGIHTGMILSGLLGLKKWQFDIWSIDTMKASQMEQKGRPGYVHITNSTLEQISFDILQELTITGLLNKKNRVLNNFKKLFKIFRIYPTILYLALSV